MSHIAHFKARAELSAAQNLANLIALARNQITLWSELEGFAWDAHDWPTHFNKLRFLKLGERNLHSSREIEPHQAMAAPFINFAKAYLRYTQHIQKTKTFKRTVAALQLLEAALLELEGTGDITRMAERHLDRAVELLKSEGLKDRQGIGNALQRLAENIGKWHIAVASTKYWKHPFTGMASNASISKRDTEAAAKKLPTDDALLALAEIFARGGSEDQDDEDVFTTCVTCLLLCAPMRINEILHFREDPLRTENDAKGNQQLHIAYWVPKNGRYVRKEIPAVMAANAREAVRRLTRITEESRRLAKHLESGSDQFYRHADCPDVPDDQVLTRAEVVQALGFNSLGSAESFIQRHTGEYRTTGWTLNSLWQVVLADHKQRNPHFPYQVDPADGDSGQPLKMSESLMCYRYQQLSTRNRTSPVLLAPMNGDFFTKRLEWRVLQRGNKVVNMNILAKHGYDGLELRSHQLRHFLNTLAQEAGVGIEAITQWSTRASQTQSRVYMHQDPDRKARQIAEKQGLVSPLTTQPVTVEEYRVMEFGPIITTRYGICTHDYTLIPCNKHADCLNCSELLLCKGHKRSIAAITEERDRVAENLAASQTKIDAGERVASRWHQVHTETLTRLDQLIQVMTDPSIEDGSAIQIQGKDFSHQARVMESRPEFQLNNNAESPDFSYSDDVAACLQMLAKEKYV
ncbi:hypothetical protein [Aeromonas caviae]|uniref:hypothetical protein n=1 Tax=Aeromonas caviae TaxID=648 RepID=UPI00227F3516|nr:hypothetical protein [Aeromonas caviae]MCY9811370.1 hypothetical protein [Aeromonas caviae]